MGRRPPTDKKAKAPTSMLSTARQILRKDEAKNLGIVEVALEPDAQPSCKGTKPKRGRPRSTGNDKPVSTPKRRKINSLPDEPPSEAEVVEDAAASNNQTGVPDENLERFTVLNRDFIIRDLSRTLKREDIDVEVLLDAIVLTCNANERAKWHMMLNRQSIDQTYVNELGTQYRDRHLALRGTKAAIPKAGRTIVAAINNSEMDAAGLVSTFLMKLFGYLKENDEEMNQTLDKPLIKAGFNFLMKSKYSALWDQNLQIAGPWELMIDPTKERHGTRDDIKSVLLNAAIAEFQSCKTRSDKLKAITAILTQGRRELDANRKQIEYLEGFLAQKGAEWEELMKLQDEEDLCYAIKIQVEQLLDPTEIDNFINVINALYPTPENPINALELTERFKLQETAWLDKVFNQVKNDN